MFNFESDQDQGPYETLFRAFQDYRVRLTTNKGLRGDVEILGANRDRVEVQLFRGSEDVATGRVLKIRYEDITDLLVY